MTAKELNKIKKLRVEIDILTEEISNEVLADTVTGSDNEDPYIKHTVKITGLTARGISKKRELKQKRAELHRLIMFIKNIEDSWIRKMFYLKFEKGLKYYQVALKMGTSEGAIRMSVTRYLQEK